MPASWDPPSPPVAALIRQAAEYFLENPDEVFAAIDAAVLADADHPAAADPVLAAAVRRNNRANLVHWARANVHAPGERVPPNTTPEVMAVARDLVRRGLDADALNGYRTGQNEAWRQWMTVAFALTTDPDQLRELLDVTARSIFTFVDETLAAITREIEQERDALTRGTHAQRLEVVSLILEAAPIGVDRASARLGYRLDRAHTAAIVWTDRPDAEPDELEAAAEAIGRAAGAQPLTIVPSASALWLWVGGAAAASDPQAVAPALAGLPGVRVALGPTGQGVAGFRRSHLDALATQRLMHRAAAPPQLATYEELQLVALAAQDDERADELVARTLGRFATAPADLRETARVYLREQSSATRAARALFTHRNTILARLARIDELLPAPLAGREQAVALALDLVRWRGAGE